MQTNGFPKTIIETSKKHSIENLTLEEVKYNYVGMNRIFKIIMFDEDCTKYIIT